MNEFWSLNELYTGFDSPEFLKDFSELPQAIEKRNQYAAGNFTNTENAQSKLEAFIRIELDMEKYTKLVDYTQLYLSVNSTDETALKYSDQLEEILSQLTPASTQFKSFLQQIDDLDNLIQSSPLLSQHSFYLKNAKELGTHVGSEQQELLLAQLQATGSSAWTKQFELLTSTLAVDIVLDGKEQHLPLTMVRNLAFSPNSETRKTAYYAEQAAYSKIEKPLAASLNAIKGEALTVASLHKWDSVLDMTLAESRMDKQALDVMWEAILETLPVFRKYLRKKASLLGHENGLPFFDIFAPVGNVNMEFTYPQAADFVVDTFTDFSPKLGTFARHAFDNAWIDVFPRDGKRGGAFCSNLHVIGQSRIMANFSGTLDGVATFAHELGHGYHGDCLMEESYLNADYPMPIAETASTFCETLLIQSALKKATSEEALSILENYLSGLTQTIVDIYSRFLFEDRVISKRKSGSLGVDELKALMLEAQKEAYGDGLDHNYLHPYMWANKPHYYEVSVNYYNFPYAFGQLLALGLYAQYLDEGESFLPKFDALFAATGKNDLYNVGQQAGIDIHSKAFWMNSLRIITGDIEKFISL